MFTRHAKTAPSQYPPFPFHGFRSFQLVASIVVGSVMAFFIWHLNHDRYDIPWTFIWLCSASFFSVLALASTIFVHCFFGLNPRVNMFVNFGLVVLWTISWTTLTWWTTETLGNTCDFDHWTEDAGVMVCRLYKTLFAFTFFGLIATLGAFVLDILVLRKQTARGAYQLHELDNKQRAQAPRDPFADGPIQQPAGIFTAPRDSEAWEEPRPSVGPYAESSDARVRSKGYSVPENQFEYDTGYHGVHAFDDSKMYDGTGVESRKFI